MRDRPKSPFEDASDPDFGLLDVGTVIAQARADAEADRRRGPEALLAAKDAWDLRDDDVLSTRHMDDDALSEAVVNDLLVLHGFEAEGFTFEFGRETLVRFLMPDQAARALAALDAPHARSFLAERQDGQLRVAPEHLQDACDFAGFWPEGVEPLTGEAVFRAAR